MIIWAERLTITRAVEATVSNQSRVTKSSTKLSWLTPEVVHTTLSVCCDLTGGNEDGVGCDSLSGEGHVKSVIVCIWCGWVLEAIEVPVCLLIMSIHIPWPCSCLKKNERDCKTHVRSQHDWGALSCSLGNNAEVPVPTRYAVGDVAYNLSWETLLSIWVYETECNAALSM